MASRFTAARRNAGLSIADVAAWLCLSIRTIQRYEHQAPEWAVILMELKAGKLEHISPDFRGWTITWGTYLQGRYWSRSYTPGEMNYLVNYPYEGGSRSEVSRSGLCGHYRDQKQLAKKKKIEKLKNYLQPQSYE